MEKSAASLDVSGLPVVLFIARSADLVFTNSSVRWLSDSFMDLPVPPRSHCSCSRRFAVRSGHCLPDRIRCRNDRGNDADDDGDRFADRVYGKSFYARRELPRSVFGSRQHSIRNVLRLPDRVSGRLVQGAGALDSAVARGTFVAKELHVHGLGYTIDSMRRSGMNHIIAIATYNAIAMPRAHEGQRNRQHVNQERHLAFQIFADGTSQL